MSKIFKENFELIYPSENAGAFQSFEYSKILRDIQTEHQHLQVFQTETLGKVLVLDGVVQCTEADEFIYHEMLVHVPMFTHPDPKKVLIIGGGDGGSLREVLKHDTVESVTMIEIDKTVMELGEKHFGADFSDSRLKIINEDAAKTVGFIEYGFDVVIVDCTDPTTTGGKSIYTKHFAADLAKKMCPKSVCSVMSGVPMAQGLSHMKQINEMMQFMGFSNALYTTTVPTYYGGLTAMTLHQRGCGQHLIRRNTDIDLKNYTMQVHQAAFVLPKWLKDMDDG